MTREDAIENSVMYLGGLVCCEICHVEPFDDFMKTQPAGGYDDLPFGLWLIEQGWQFEWREHDHEGEPGSGKYPFAFCTPESENSRSWSFSWVCPTCRSISAA